jgi:hypothetical protein
MNKTSKPATTITAAKAEATERKPDFYDRVITTRPDEASRVLASLCRRKDYFIRRVMADHEAGITFDEAIKALAEVYKANVREARS